MKLSDNDLAYLALHAITAARKAADIIVKYSQLDVAVRTKVSGDSLSSQVVTEVDILCQKVILEILQPTIEAYELGFLAEESTDNSSRLKKDYFWCIDPLDGTLPFIESTPGYAVSIALVSRCGTSCIGVVHDPVTDTYYHAVKGLGAFRNGMPLVRQDLPDLNAPLTVATGRSFPKHPLYEQTVAELECYALQAGHDGLDVIQHGGAVMNACWVLERPPACYVKYPTEGDSGGSLWDYAATACIYSELGMPCRDIYGNALELNRPESTFMNHRGIVYASSSELADIVRRVHNRLTTDS